MSLAGCPCTTCPSLGPRTSTNRHAGRYIRQGRPRPKGFTPCSGGFPCSPLVRSRPPGTADADPARVKSHLRRESSASALSAGLHSPGVALRVTRGRAGCKSSVLERLADEAAIPFTPGDPGSDQPARWKERTRAKMNRYQGGQRAELMRPPLGEGRFPRQRGSHLQSAPTRIQTLAERLLRFELGAELEGIAASGRLQSEHGLTPLQIRLAVGKSRPACSRLTSRRRTSRRRSASLARQRRCGLRRRTRTAQGDDADSRRNRSSKSAFISSRQKIRAWMGLPCT
jgi:hypothetical protein